jgi:hypothetical protein
MDNRAGAPTRLECFDNRKGVCDGLSGGARAARAPYPDPDDTGSHEPASLQARSGGHMAGRHVNWPSQRVRCAESELTAALAAPLLPPTLRERSLVSRLQLLGNR